MVPKIWAFLIAGHKQGAGCKVEQLGHKSVPDWDISTYREF